MGYLSNYGRQSRRQWSDKYLNLINHVAFVIDASGSMRHLRSAVVNLLHEQIKLLAQRSEESGQETRVSIYFFDDNVECVVYDRDVLRPLDLSDIFQVLGSTALMDATMLGVNELSQTATLHGDHAFWLNIITDGGENASRQVGASHLRARLESLPENWTMACFIPNQGYAPEVQRYGFPVENIVKWDASVEGVQRMSATLSAATDTYFAGRTSGTRGYSKGGLFGGGVDTLNSATVQRAGLVEVDPKRFAVFTLAERIEAKDFCEQKGFEYRNGVVFYEWFNTQDIQAQKTVLFQNIKNGKVFSAPMGSQAARDLLGLAPGMTVRGKPAPNPEWRRFIQSTAPNRKLIPGKHALVLDAKRTLVPTH